jgi:hypothetical protein
VHLFSAENASASMEFQQEKTNKVTQYRVNGKFTDVTLLFEGGREKCHRLVLASACDYFESMFLSACEEATAKEVCLFGIGASTGRLLIDYLYNGKITLTCDNAEDVLAAADMLLLNRITKMAEEFLCGQVIPSTAIALFYLAEKFSLAKLRGIAHSVLLDDFEEICELGEIGHLMEEDFIDLLKSTKVLSYGSEVSYDAVQVWMNAKDGRQDRFHHLLSHVELGAMSAKFLVRKVMSEKLLCNRDGMQLLQAALEKSLASTFVDTPQTVTFMGDMKGHLWKMEGQQWTELENIPHEYTYRYANSGVLYKDAIILTGGSNSGYSYNISCDVFKYTPRTNTWEKLPSMKHKRSSHATIIYKGQLYAIGGFVGCGICVEEVEKYDFSSQEWLEVASLPEEWSQPYIAVANDMLFAMGGRNRREYTVNCYVLNKVKSEWSRVASMPRSCMDGCCAVARNQIYIFGARIPTMRYDPTTDTWMKLTMPLYQHSFGACITTENKILVLGGVQQHAEYDIDADEWSAWNTTSSLTSSNVVFACRMLKSQIAD